MKKQYTTGLSIYYDDEEYHTQPVDHIIKKYLSQPNVDEESFWKKFDLLLIKKIFLLAIKDFLEKKINIDDFGTVCGALLHNNPIWDWAALSKYDYKLPDILNAGEELVFENRHQKKKGNANLTQSDNLKAI